jgi:hypothetical protein
MNWIVQEAQKQDPRKDRMILENPAAVRELDELLTQTYYPQIKPILLKCGYPFSSIDENKIPIESRWSGSGLGRCLIFMLFDHFARPILRGSLILSRDGFMFEREFFLGLPQTTDPSFLFRILSDEDFAGNSPSLTVEPSDIYPEWNAYYWITLRSGAGIGSSQWTFHQAALGNIEETIETSVDMYETAIEGFATMADVEDFLTLARKCFESS